jgi:hypothetical protein
MEGSLLVHNPSGVAGITRRGFLFCAFVKHGHGSLPLFLVAKEFRSDLFKSLVQGDMLLAPSCCSLI